ncbi:hypothetical protein [Cumulibacter soli]|uniref:hypothetical protein n=1 Tax=Cumulibacter soli TaxID=2546344 RepID=UPI001067D744|nr:hypothetical protein [Cumulibacter soli]
MTDNGTPAWRQAFNKAERAVGEPLEKAIDTREFANLITVTAKVRKGVQRQIYGVVNRSLHFVGLSTLKDTRDIARQLNRVQQQLREVSIQLEAIEERDTPSDPAHRSRPAPMKPMKAPPAKKSAPAKRSKPAPARTTQSDSSVTEGD